MIKWYNEEFTFKIEVTGYLFHDSPINHCRNGEEIGDVYCCGYGCPVNKNGCGICSKTMLLLFPLMDAVRSGGDLRNLGGDSKYSKEIVCPDGVVKFKLTAQKIAEHNFHTGGFYKN